MDKKKVRKLLEDSDICFLGYERNGCRDLIQMGLEKLHEAQKELSKSDWVSIEDGLPEYMENVVICNAKYPDNLYVSYRDNGEYSKDESRPMMDNNGFIIDVSNFLGKVTHWKPIEKLEE